MWPCNQGSQVVFTIAKFKNEINVWSLITKPHCSEIDSIKRANYYPLQLPKKYYQYVQGPQILQISQTFQEKN